MESVDGKRSTRLAALLLVELLGALILLAALTGCSVEVGDAAVGSGEVTTETRVVEDRGVSSAEVRLDMPVGRLQVAAGADSAAGSLMEGVFRYGKDHWRPVVDYQATGGRGRLAVSDDGLNSIALNGLVYEWDVLLAGGMPLDLDVHMGPGDADLDLRGLDVRELDLDMGPGRAVLDLRGEREDPLRATIDQGVGDLRIVLPAEVSCRVDAQQDVGQVRMHGLRQIRDGVYVNDAYDDGALMVDLLVDSRVGVIELEVGR